MWLTSALRQILVEMIEAEARDDLSAAEIVCDGLCYIGNRRIHPGSVARLLQLMAISDRSGGEKMKRYVINDMGRAVVQRPAIIGELSDALRAKKNFTVRDNRIEII